MAVLLTNKISTDRFSIVFHQNGLCWLVILKGDYRIFRGELFLGLSLCIYEMEKSYWRINISFFSENMLFRTIGTTGQFGEQLNVFLNPNNFSTSYALGACDHHDIFNISFNDIGKVFPGWRWITVCSFSGSGMDYNHIIIWHSEISTYQVVLLLGRGIQGNGDYYFINATLIYDGQKVQIWISYFYALYDSPCFYYPLGTGKEAVLLFIIMLIILFSKWWQG